MGKLESGDRHETKPVHLAIQFIMAILFVTGSLALRLAWPNFCGPNLSDGRGVLDRLAPRAYFPERRYAASLPISALS